MSRELTEKVAKSCGWTKFRAYEADMRPCCFMVSPDGKHWWLELFHACFTASGTALVRKPTTKEAEGPKE